MASDARPMAITAEGTLKPVADFGAAEKWWCDCRDKDGPHVHPRDLSPALSVDLLTGHDERSPSYRKKDGNG